MCYSTHSMKSAVPENSHKDSSKTFQGVSELLSKGVDDEVFPGAVLLVGHRGKVLFFESVGKNCLPEFGEPTSMSKDTVFDIASLTQPVITAMVMARLVDENKFKLEERVSRFIPSFGVHGKSEIKVKNLLDHSSGLPHWLPIFEELVELNTSSRFGIIGSAAAKEHTYNVLHRLNPKNKTAKAQLFSDLGYIILGEVIERATGALLNKAAYKSIFQPLEIKSTSFIDLSLIRRGTLQAVSDIIAPTELCPWRKRMIWGEVHDDNAWAMGGISGHGGCFSTALDLHTIVSHLLSGFYGESEFLSKKVVREFLYPWIHSEIDQSSFDSEIISNAALAEHRWRYGWEGVNEDNGMDQAGLSPFAVGHSGFTGCSVWLEPKAGIDIILLSNRIHPSRNNKKIKSFRPEIHKAIVDVLNS